MNIISLRTRRGFYIALLGACLAASRPGAISLGAQTVKWEVVDTLSNLGQSIWSSLDCSDSLHCMAMASWPGIVSNVYATSDGGRSWDIVYYEDTGTVTRRYPLLLWGISTPTHNLAIVTADSGYILRTTDGGNTWQESRIIETAQVLGGGAVSMYDENHGVLLWEWPHFDTAMGPEFLMATSDGGITWYELPTSPIHGEWDWEIQAPYCIGPGRYICQITDDTYRIRIASTSDGGNTWRYAENPVQGENSLQFAHFQFFDSLFGYLGAIDFGSDWASVFARTTDGGVSWELLHHGDIDGENGGMYSISFRDRQNGIAGGPGSIFRTSDSGRTWSLDSLELERPSTAVRVDVAWLGEMEGVAVSRGYKTYRLVPPISSVVSENLLYPDLSIAVVPNPTVGEAPIRARILLRHPGAVQLELYDLSGALLVSSQSARLSPGTHEVEIRLPGMHAGAYLLRAKAGGRVAERKVVVR